MKNVINKEIQEFVQLLNESLDCINRLAISANTYLFQGSKSVALNKITCLTKEVNQAKQLVEEFKAIKFVTIQKL